MVCLAYYHLRGGWYKRKGGAKSINVEVGINVEERRKLTTTKVFSSNPCRPLDFPVDPTAIGAESGS